MRIGHKSLEQFIQIAYKNRKPLFIWGTMGIGKSQTIKETAVSIAKKKGKDFVDWSETDTQTKKDLMKNPKDKFIYADIRLSQTDPTDLKGVPNLFTDLGACQWELPMLFVTLSNPEADGFLFFDEFNLAVQSIMASAYQIIHDRKVGEYPISKQVGIFAAGNTSEDRAGVFELPAPLRNRFMHVTLDRPSAEDWIDWAVGLNKHIDHRILGFLKAKPDLLFSFDPKNNKQVDNAFATPRTWEMFSDVLSSVEADTDAEATDKFISSLASAVVGDGISAAFMAFIKLQRHWDLFEFLENPEKAAVLKEESPDVKWAIVVGLADFWRYPPAKLPEKIKSNLLDIFFQIIKNMDPEFGIYLAKLLKKGSTSPTAFANKAKNSPTFKEFVQTHGKFLTIDI